MNPKATVITKKDLIITAKKKGIKEPHKMSTKNLLDTHNRYEKKRDSYNIGRRFNRLGLKNIGKRQNITKSDLNNAIQLHNKSLRDLQKLAKLRRIKNSDNLSKEDLIYTLLRTKEYLFENSYAKYINNDTNNPIKAKINKIRITATKLGHILTKEERNFIREKLYKLENKKRSTKSEKQKALAYLIELANTLD